MKLCRLTSAVLVVVLLAPALVAAEDVTGNWKGSFAISLNGEKPRDDVAYMVLKQTGTELTGSAGSRVDQQWPIVKGKIVVTKVDGKESTKLLFVVEPAGPGGPTMQFDLELIDGHLKGKAKVAEDGMDLSGVLDLTRVK